MTAAQQQATVSVPLTARGLNALQRELLLTGKVDEAGMVAVGNGRTAKALRRRGLIDHACRWTELGRLVVDWLDEQQRNAPPPEPLAVGQIVCWDRWPDMLFEVRQLGPRRREDGMWQEMANIATLDGILSGYVPLHVLKPAN